MSPTRLNNTQAPVQQQNTTTITVKSEPGIIDVMEHSSQASTEHDDEEKPTDLSMVHQPADLSMAHQPTDLSSSGRHAVNKNSLSESNHESSQFHSSINIKADMDADIK